MDWYEIYRSSLHRDTGIFISAESCFKKILSPLFVCFLLSQQLEIITPFQLYFNPDLILRNYQVSDLTHCSSSFSSSGGGFTKHNISYHFIYFTALMQSSTWLNQKVVLRCVKTQQVLTDSAMFKSHVSAAAQSRQTWLYIEPPKILLHTTKERVRRGGCSQQLHR